MKNIIFLIHLLTISLTASGWEPKGDRLKTKWSEQINPEKALLEYPRPQMVRKNWMNLNGLWDFTTKLWLKNKFPDEWSGKILVPFPIESSLSGVMNEVGLLKKLWYRRSFNIPAIWDDYLQENYKILIHFGAVDWESQLWINDKWVGQHRGGYDNFTYDITPFLQSGREQEIKLSVLDPSEMGLWPRGKQSSKPDDIWYTSSTGIWQTVWLELVPKIHIKKLEIIPNIDSKSASLRAYTNSHSQHNGSLFLDVKLYDSKTNQAVSEKICPLRKEINLKIINPKLWSPDSPFLYDLHLRLLDQNKNIIDEVTSYLGMRKISVEKDAFGISRIFLNNKPMFQLGVLDQGFWPDGLYTAPADNALRFDIQTTKKLGFNMIRKHIKVEPQRWYYWCDRLGVLVWQDMPNGNFLMTLLPHARKQFKNELQQMIDNLKNHPSIIMWVIFNEGWGQHNTRNLTNWALEFDSTRLISNASGWHDRQVGNIIDIHSYPGPEAPRVEDSKNGDRAAVLGEFGGLGLPVRGHLWNESNNWDYVGYKTEKDLTEAYVNLLKQLQKDEYSHLSAAVYTQITDVESEINGFMTYDRMKLKVDEQKIKVINDMVIQSQSQSE